MSTAVPQTIIIDVRVVPKPERHAKIFDALQKLAVDASVLVKNDHDPVPLRRQVESIFGDQFTWRYLQEGPETYQLQFTRRNPAPADWTPPQPLAPRADGLPMATETPTEVPAPTVVDLLAVAETNHSGPQWATESEDLDVTLLSWKGGEQIEPHGNSEVDVLWAGVTGTGVVTINGEKREIRPGVAFLIPKGSTRAVESTSEKLVYLSVHRRRRGLMPTFVKR